MYLLKQKVERTVNPSQNTDQNGYTTLKLTIPRRSDCVHSREYTRNYEIRRRGRQYLRKQLYLHGFLTSLHLTTG